MKNETNRTFNLLPRVHRTAPLNKFFGATVDQLFSKPELKKVTGYVGRREGDYYNPKDDYYHTEKSASRLNYQLEPMYVLRDVGNDSIVTGMFYEDMLQKLKSLGANIDNQERLFSTPQYSWAPPIDIDKYVNYQNYYWYPEGVLTPLILIGDDDDAEGTINVEEDILGATSYISPNGIELSSGMYIQFGEFVVPDRYRNGTIWIVENVGRSIQLMDASLIDRSVSYIKFADLEYDNSILPQGSTDIQNGWDSKGFDGAPVQTEAMIDYVTIQRGAHNRNVWSRLNCWFHKDVLEAAVDRTRYVDRYSLYQTDIIGWDDSLMPTGTKDYDRGFDAAQFDGIRYKEQRPPFSLDHTRQAKRPILEFYNDIELMNTGIEHLTTVPVAADANRSDYITTVSAPRTMVLEFVADNGSYYIDLYDEKLTSSVDAGDVFVVDTGNGNQAEYLIMGKNNSLLYIDSSTPFSSKLEESYYSIERRMPIIGIKFDGISVYSSMKVVFIGYDSKGVFDSNIYEVRNVNEQLQLKNVGTVIEDGHSILVSNGKFYAGMELHWQDNRWNFSQQKLKPNQHPKFVYTDHNGIRIDDPGEYPGSNFEGGSIFSLAPGTGPIDSSLQQSVKRRELGQVSDIVYTNNLLTDTYSSDFGTIPQNYYRRVTVSPNDGSEPSSRMTYTIANDWHKAALKSRQPVVDKYLITNPSTRTYLLGAIPRVGADGFAEVVVKVNAVPRMQGLEPHLGEYTVSGRFITFSEFIDLNQNDFVEVYYGTNDAIALDSVSYSTLPNNLELNPKNSEMRETSPGEILSHFRSIIDNQPRINGYSFGTNNYRDTARDLSLGTGFMQYNYSMLPLMYLLTDSVETDIVESIQFNKFKYTEFKRQLVDNIYNLDVDTTKSVKTLLSEILTKLYKASGYHNVFSKSKLLAYADNHQTRVAYVLDGIAEFGIELLFTEEERNSATYVYNDRTGKQLLRGVDFRDEQMQSDSGSYVTKLILMPSSNTITGDKLTVNVYENISGSFVPVTPATMGLGRLHAPRIEMDDSFVEPTAVIVGHDGSRFVGFTDADDELNDLRNAILLEFEQRVYSTTPIDFRDVQDARFDITEVISGKYRKTSYSIDETNKLLQPSFLKWAYNNGVSYDAHDVFDDSIWQTWNYSSAVDVTGEKLHGHWKGIYNYYFDTIHPHTTPWEMLGFLTKPMYWEETYGSDYSSENVQLWSDLQDGKIVSGARNNVIDGSYALASNPFARPGLMFTIPVGPNNVLLSPHEAGILTIQLNFDQKMLPWVYGDRAPAEYSFWTSSEAMFSLERMKFLARPAHYVSYGLDTVDTVYRNGQLLSNELGRRKVPSEIAVHNDDNYVHGFQID